MAMYTTATPAQPPSEMASTPHMAKDTTAKSENRLNRRVLTLANICDTLKRKASSRCNLEIQPEEMLPEDLAENGRMAIESELANYLSELVHALKIDAGVEEILSYWQVCNVNLLCLYLLMIYRHESTSILTYSRSP